MSEKGWVFITGCLLGGDDWREIFARLSNEQQHTAESGQSPAQTEGSLVLRALKHNSKSAIGTEEGNLRWATIKHITACLLNTVQERKKKTLHGENVTVSLFGSGL